MPKVGYDIVCKDFEHKICGSALENAERLGSNILYYYYDNVYEKLFGFNDLQRLVLSVWIKKLNNNYEPLLEGKQYLFNYERYVIEIRDYDAEYFSNVNSQISLVADDSSTPVELIDMYYKEHNKVRKCIVLFPFSDDFISRWMPSHFDMSYICGQLEIGSFNLEVPAFLKIDTCQSSIILSPNFLHFRILYGKRSICDEKYLFGN